MIFRSAKFAFEFLFLALIALAILFTGLVGRITYAPLNLNFLNPYIENALQGEGATYQVRVNNTSISWARWDRPFDLSLLGIKLIDRDQSVIGEIGEVSLKFSFRGITHGLVAPRSLEIVKPSIRIIRGLEGEFKFELGGKASNVAGDTNVFQKLLAILKADDRSDQPLTYLQEASIIDGTIVFEDLKTGIACKFLAANLTLKSDSQGFEANFSGGLQQDSLTARIKGSGKIDTRRNEVLIGIDVVNFNPKSLFRNAIGMEYLGAFDLNQTGLVSFRKSLEESTAELSFSLGSGPGKVLYGRSGLDLIPIKSSHIAGGFDFHESRLSIDKLRFAIGGSVFTGQLGAFKRGESIGVKLRTRVDEIKVKEILRLWPRNYLNQSASWITQNIAKGQLNDAEIASEFLWQGPAQASRLKLRELKGNAKLSNISFIGSDVFPPVQKVSGLMEFGMVNTVFKSLKGEWNRIKLEDGQINFNHSQIHFTPIHAEFSLTGGVNQKILGLKYFMPKFFDRSGMADKVASGNVRTDFRGEWILDGANNIQNVGFNFNSKLEDITIKNLINETNISKGNFKLIGNSRGIDLEGDCEFGGGRIKVRWLEHLETQQPYVRQIFLTGNLDQMQRKSLGFRGMISEGLVGPIGIDLALFQPGPHKPTQVVGKLNFQDTEIYYEGLDFKKKPGEPWIGWMRASLGEQGAIKISSLNITAPNFEFAGSFEFDRDGELAQADLRRVKFGFTDVSILIIPDKKSDGFAAKVAGNSLDLSGVSTSGFLGAIKTDLGPLKIDFSIGRIFIGFQANLYRAKGFAVIEKDGRKSLRMISQLSSGDSVNVDFRTGPENEYIRIRTVNAGQLIKEWRLSDAFRGGRLDIIVKRTKANARSGWRGVAEMREFSMVDAPILARLLSLASLTGILNTMAGEGVAFRRLYAPFEWVKDKITFNNVRAVGSELGITGKGTYSFGRDFMDLRGTIVPAYTINSVLGNIPLLGDILTGTKGSGVFAATYRVIGNKSDPGVRVNPLSALAPGFLRNLVEIFETDELRVPDPRVKKKFK
jgi:hypothetical protein